MTLLNHAVPRTQEQQPTILDALIVTDPHQHIDRGLYTYIKLHDLILGLAQAYRLSLQW
jgi:hypothetical protein